MSGDFEGIVCDEFEGRFMVEVLFVDKSEDL
jgi:hypothetical protein